MIRLLFTLSLLASAPLLATAKEPIQCGNVNGINEWRLTIDLKNKTASFFDNDSTVTIPFKTNQYLKSNPPQTLHLFEGKDGVGENVPKMGITFNETKMTAFVTVNLGTKKEKTYEALDGCK